MLRHLWKPCISGAVFRVVPKSMPRVIALVDDGLLLLLQQRNQLLLGADVAPYVPVGMIEEAEDGGLFGEAVGPEMRTFSHC